MSSTTSTNSGTTDSAATKQQGNIRQMLRKTKLCEHFQNGSCSFAMACAFAHSRNELRHAPDLYKTKLCAFTDGSGCKRPQCSFAHTDEELRNPIKLEQRKQRNRKAAAAALSLVPTEEVRHGKKQEDRQPMNTLVDSRPPGIHLDGPGFTQPAARQSRIAALGAGPVEQSIPPYDMGLYLHMAASLGYRTMPVPEELGGGSMMKGLSSLEPMKIYPSQDIPVSMSSFSSASTGFASDLDAEFRFEDSPFRQECSPISVRAATAV